MKTDDPLVSIGLPVYNDVLFLENTLISIINQSYKNFELIISDDCSNDGSKDICNEYLKRDTRIRYIRQPRNIGISRNMEFLLKEATGVYFMWAGDDDMLDRDFIKLLVDSHVKNKNIIVAFGPVIFINENGIPLDNPKPRSTDYSGLTPYSRLKKLICIYDDSFGYGLFKRELIISTKFPIWKFMNKKIPYNNIYPTLCYYLTLGDFYLYNSKTLWYNRIKENKNVNYKYYYGNNVFVSLLSMTLLKINLVVSSCLMIKKGRGSYSLILTLLPSFIYYWLIKHLIKEYKIIITKYFSRK